MTCQSPIQKKLQEAISKLISDIFPYSISDQGYLRTLLCIYARVYPPREKRRGYPLRDQTAGFLFKSIKKGY
ncbi:hypothetical protein SERLA73DRAFT_187006 [Serpula lacrymans var. lacrymans S7.3]|uniref:Uncharacterized protein n=2 Tax=Serpula lacrymans var. lacrymans TaxID=341189 RepID=F8Q896_SERL3|nr:uncharacterized protein SERLADRAFT_476333 [Serpula lacrymans var. lacrymans S7.9]EGN95784.1 hypothetical protein SERLA73DRAFT_187006 [Serpula lacrymans var. lacrymans S7.3]EGO21306.1 hypothetical protein SERLADRAFT_476333 [Serpula lacrymans var. lacrymans S7.9]